MPDDAFEPFVYPVDDVWRPVLPFLIAPVGRSQDKVLIGPQVRRGGHADFIEAVYEGEGGGEPVDVSVRTFSYRGATHAAVVTRSGIADEVGRMGLHVAYGFRVAPGAEHFPPALFAAYLDHLSYQLQNHLGISDVSGGVDTFVDTLNHHGPARPMRFDVCGRECLLTARTLGLMWTKRPLVSQLYRLGRRLSVRSVRLVGRRYRLSNGEMLEALLAYRAKSGYRLDGAIAVRGSSTYPTVLITDLPGPLQGCARPKLLRVGDRFLIAGAVVGSPRDRAVDTTHGG